MIASVQNSFISGILPRWLQRPLSDKQRRLQHCSLPWLQIHFMPRFEWWQEAWEYFANWCDIFYYNLFTILIHSGDIVCDKCLVGVEDGKWAGGSKYIILVFLFVNSYFMVIFHKSRWYKTWNALVEMEPGKRISCALMLQMRVRRQFRRQDFCWG